MPPLSWEDFEKVEIRVGTIIATEEFPEARKPAYKITIDFGPAGTKKSSAQVTTLYSRTDLLNRQVIAVTNFPPKQIANFLSECLILGIISHEGAVVLVQPDRKVADGLRIA
jgi:tRNA-binding protein